MAEDLGPIGALGAVAIVAPHPDDESLGCGGLIARLCRAGSRVRTIIVSDGSRSHPGSRQFPPEAVRELRAREALAATEALGLARDCLVFMKLPDGAVPHPGAVGFGEAARTMGRLLAGFDTVVAPYRADAHGDHRASFELVRAALAQRSEPARLLEYAIWPGEGGIPPARWRLDVRDVLPHKRAAIACHRSQLGLVIDDDPSGFRLEPEFIDRFLTPDELYLEAPDAR